jgi:hypothetical protein
MCYILHRLLCSRHEIGVMLSLIINSTCNERLKVVAVHEHGSTFFVLRKFLSQGNLEPWSNRPAPTSPYRRDPL